MSHLSNTHTNTSSAPRGKMAMANDENAIPSVGQIIPVESSLEYRWEIPNFSSECRKPVGEKMTSPSFTIDDRGESTWNLELFPNGYNSSNAGHLVMLLSTNDESTTGVRFKFSIIDAHKRVVDVHESNPITVSRSTKTGAVLMKTAALLQRATEILVMGRLTILCEISVDCNKPASCRAQRLRQFDKYESMLNNKKYSDLTIVVQGKRIYAHKAIATFGSPVFAAMLEHKMRESMSNQIVIEDAGYAVFRELLRFMYCGKVHKIEKIADELFVVADKYELLELKEMCENSLCENLTVARVIEFLRLADMHHAGKLRSATISYVVAKSKEVIERPEFNTILKLNEEIVMEIMRGLVARQAADN